MRSGRRRRNSLRSCASTEEHTAALHCALPIYGKPPARGTVVTNAAELEDLRDLIAARIGLMLDAGKLDQLETVLAARSRATGATPRHYVDAIAPTQAELSQIMRMLAVSETYFFRNAAHFRVLEELIARRRGSTIRILSAGCSSGEEPYTIAMIAREVLGERDAGSVSILGVDLNPDAIAKARAAVYTPWSLRETPAAFAQKFFRTVGSEHRLIDEVERMVRFEERNLLDPMSRTFHRESCDAIFCQNVLMYLKPSSAAELVSTISRALVADGLLFLGHAVNLRGLSTDFHLRHTHDAFYYER